MKKLIAIFAALMVVIPLTGCSGEEEDAGEVTIDGQKPDVNADPTNEVAGGAEPMEPQ